MKRIIVHIILIIAAISVICSKYTHVIAVKGILPDLLLILTVYTGLFHTAYFAMFFGFAAGLALDFMMFPLYPLGFNAFIYTLIGYLCFIPNKFFQIENSFISSIAIFIYFTLKSFVYFILCILLSVEIENTFVIESIYTIVVSIPVFYLYYKIFQFNLSLKKHV